MKTLHIYIFIINLFLGGIFIGFSQEENSMEQKPDSIFYQERYGIRIGTDLSKPIRSLLDNKYNSGFEIKGDFRLTKRLFPAIEIGYEDFDYDENNFNANSAGGFTKLGVNYNAYENWLGMQNEIYVGLRYGFSTFSQTIYDYTIYDLDHYFPPEHHQINQKFKNLNAHWVELQVGLKAEVLQNLYLGFHVEVKRIITEKEPNNFENLWIPGYNRKYADSPFGVGWGYSISYLIPILKKDKIERLK